MASRLHLGNLPYSVTEDELRQLFSQVGTVESVEIVKDRYTGRPRGFAYVDMADIEQAQAAIRQFNGYTLENRSIRVEMAKERVPREGGPGAGPRPRTGFAGGRRREPGRQRGARGGRWAA